MENKYCNFCDCKVKASSWWAHSNSNKHKKNTGEPIKKITHTRIKCLCKAEMNLTAYKNHLTSATHRINLEEEEFIRTLDKQLEILNKKLYG